MDITQLPFIDEHTAMLDVDAADVWPELLEAIDRSFSHRFAELYARTIRCDEYEATGPRPLALGSTVPGFRVTTFVPRSELVLEGHHRFSSYALSFRVEHLRPGRSRLRAETRAAFPGVAGRAYRLLVIGTGGHVVAVRRLLAGITRRAEARVHASV